MTSKEPPEALDAADPAFRASVGRAALWVVVEKWSGRILSLAVFAVLTRFVAVDDFGLISTATVALSFVLVFVDSGFSKALIQRDMLEEKDASTAFWTSIVISVVLAGALAAASPLVALAYRDPEITPVLIAMSLGLPLSALSGVPAALLERSLQFRKLAIRQLVGAVVGAAIAVPLAVLGFGVWALVAQTLGALIGSVITLWSSTEWRPRLEFSVPALRRMWGFAISFLGVEILNTIQMNIDKLVIGLFLGPTALGYYYVGQRAVIILTDLLSAILSRIALSTFSRLQGDQKRIVRVLNRFVFASGAIAVPVFGICALVAPQLIPFLFGSQWAITATIFQLLAPSAALNSMTSIDKNVLLASGNNRAAVTIGLAQVLLGGALLGAAMPFGILVVAASRSLLALVLIPLRAWLIKRHIGQPVVAYLVRIGICAVALVPSVVLVLFLQTTNWARLPDPFWVFAVPVSVISLLLYVGTLLLICGRQYRAFIFDTLASLLPHQRAEKGAAS